MTNYLSIVSLWRRLLYDWSFVVIFKIYYDKSEDGASWILIARFSNNEAANWMDFQGSWWYDVSAGIGNKTDPSSNADMISPAFWLVSGKKFKISRSDDPQHTPLLETTGECLGGRSFRHKMTTFGDFKDRRVWASDRYKGTYMVQYGEQYQTTDGFQKANCNRTLQSAKQIGFWCDWGDGGGSVIMIGGGGKCRSRDWNNWRKFSILFRCC